MKSGWMILLLMCAPEAWARTIWSGSFVALDAAGSRVDVSANYPARGAGKICGIELKSNTMILNRRVWERVADGLVVTSTSERHADSVPPYFEVAEGPRLSYFFGDFDADYATLSIATQSGEGLAAYFSRTIGDGQGAEAVIAVARECPASVP